MSAWVKAVIELIRAADFGEARRTISASSSLEDLRLLEQTLQSANFSGRLEITGVMAAIRHRLAVLSAEEEATPTPDDDPTP
jgi:hypothetical protein